MTRYSEFEIDCVDGRTKATGVKVPAAPFFVRKISWQGGDTGYGASHIPSGRLLNVGWKLQSAAINGVRRWWASLSDSVRARIAAAHSAEEFWATLPSDIESRRQELRLGLLVDISDFTVDFSDVPENNWPKPQGPTTPALAI